MGENIANRYISDEDLAQHEYTLQVCREFNQFVAWFNKNYFGFNERSEEEQKEIMETVADDKELFVDALAEPLARDQAVRLLSNMIAGWRYAAYGDGPQFEVWSKYALAVMDLDWPITEAALLNSTLTASERISFGGFLYKKGSYQQRKGAATIIEKEGAFLLNQLERHDNYYLLPSAILLESDNTDADLYTKLLEGLKQRAAETEDLEEKGLLFQTIYFGDYEYVLEQIGLDLGAAGLPRQPFTDVWRWTQREENEGTICIDHFVALMKLEKTDPGLCRFLWEEFSIVNFGRYPAEVLRQQAKEFDRPGDYALVVYAYDDYNGAFNNQLRIEDFHKQLDRKLPLRIAEVSGLLDMVRTLVRLEQRYRHLGKIQFADLGGHGTIDSIQLGEKIANGSHLYSKDLQRPGAGRLRKLFKTDATILLESCSTGQEHGIGQEISELFMGLTVIAPKVPAGVNRIIAEQRTDGTWLFGATYREKSIRAAYIRGQNLEEDV